MNQSLSATPPTQRSALSIPAHSPSPTSTVSVLCSRIFVMRSLTHGRPDFNVTGTSSGREGNVVVDIQCSATCEDITAVNTSLTSPGGVAEYVCKNIASEDQVRVCCLPLARVICSLLTGMLPYSLTLTVRRPPTNEISTRIPPYQGAVAASKADLP